LAAASVDAVRVALRGRRQKWIRHQGRANAALLLLAEEMTAEFVPPARETDFAAVQGRARGCTFALRVSGTRRERDSVLELTVRHYSAQTTVRLDGPGCVVPDLEPAQLRVAIEEACHGFATDQ
jgi:hypothetical protein